MKRFLTIFFILTSFFILSSTQTFAQCANGNPDGECWFGEEDALPSGTANEETTGAWCGEGWSEGPTGLCISDDDSAEDDWWLAEPTEADKSNGEIKIYTTENVPGWNCKCWVMDAEWSFQDVALGSNGKCMTMQTRLYECTVQSWLGSFQEIFAKIIKYLINIVLLLGVLAIVGLGIAWSWAGWDDAKAKSTLKKWGINIVIGLTILFLFQYILRFLAPWIYQ